MTKQFSTIIILFLLQAVGGFALRAQVTAASGIVRDSTSGEPVSFVSVVFERSLQGTMTDDKGFFRLQNDAGYTRLAVSFLGYETKTVLLKAGTKSEGLNVLLRPVSFEIDEVVVRPDRERYSRRDNPAVELIKKVIEHKSDNRIESKDEYKVEVYEKLSLSLDNFNPNIEKGMMKRFSFVKNYLDTSEISGKPILTLSVRETLSDYYYRKSPKTEKTLTKAKHQQGIDKTLDDSGTITANLEEIFKGVNISDNNVTILLNRFVSPLSSVLAVSYYKYYIMDTLDVAGDRCVDLAFVPVNSQSYGFTGRLYVTLDGKYAVKKFLLNVPKDINLNWVDGLRIEQEFKRGEDSTWVVSSENTYINFYVVHGAQQLYAHQFRHFDKYDFAPAGADSVFNLIGALHTLPEAEAQEDTFWINNRHVPLREKENALKDLIAELRKVPSFNAVIKTVEVLLSGYIPTMPEKDESLFDFGPMNTTFSANRLEGFRIRAGGMTTANLNPRWFASGYVAYGTDDRKLKYQAKLTHSFTKKKYHERESPVNNLSILYEYDLYTPGQDFLFTSKDNMFVALKVGEPVTKMQYIRKTLLQYEKEWLNNFGLRAWLRHENNEAVGSLHYNRYDTDGSFTGIRSFNLSEAGLHFRFAPGERAYNSRMGKGSAANLSKDAPIFTASHQTGFKGVLGGEYNVHHTEAGMDKRIWLSSFGHIDVTVKAGKVWNAAPFPLLILPNTNQSIAIQPEAFAMMRALEFVTDQYASFYVTYYLKGWILNRIPYVKWLKLREVLSVNGIYGSLSDKNNPALNPAGLFQFPEGTRPLGKTPYIEASVGLDNVFKILRIDYYRRLTYLNEPNIKKGGVRIALRFSF
ncbi:TonB-linked outer membrane protein, SusC/RagA family [Bacteroidales bacterium Barb6XT]|nr:TonB-linked outer membrane protein, SusC/RagA family [Bacteroidales bacterium Barb6XT]